ncbi:MAG: S8 family serine peptidase [Mobilitalea sp.]
MKKKRFLNSKIVKTLITVLFLAFAMIVDPCIDNAGQKSELSAVKDKVIFSLNSETKETKLAKNKLAQAGEEVKAMSISNDAYSDTQWAIDNSGSYFSISQAGTIMKSSVADVDMDVVEAWKNMNKDQTEDRQIIVAVIDTGVDYKHPDLADNMWMNNKEIADDNIDNDDNGYVDDIYGWDFYNDDASVCHYAYNEALKMNLADPVDNDNHGTHVAGIIGAVANNQLGIAGVASNIDIKIMALKINGGVDGSGYLESAIEAVKYATLMGADICNMSWGTSEYSEELEKTMSESDMLFVAAAGNHGINNNTNPIYPACFDIDNLISVTFINARGELISGSSSIGNSTVDIAAPGVDIVSTVVGDYSVMSGSSMAAPQVSAVAAIIYACGKHLYPSDVKGLILGNIKPLANLEGYIINAGMPSANKSVIASGTLKQDADAPKMSFESVYNGGKIDISIKAEDIGSSKIRVIRWMFGEKSAKDFDRGMSGTSVIDNQITVFKAGVYTFYASDYAGNEALQTYVVTEDNTAPKIKSSYTVSNGYKTRTITVKASDSQSGIKRVEYMAGNKKTYDFLPSDAGTELELMNGKVSFKVKKDGTYTIFASDNRGNMTVKKVVVTTIKATAIKFMRTQKTLDIGNNYFLRTLITPEDSTDKITYSSSDEEVVSVTSKGEVKALSDGMAYISAKTSSGRTAIIKIIVLSEDNKIASIKKSLFLVRLQYFGKT